MRIIQWVLMYNRTAHPAGYAGRKKEDMTCEECLYCWKDENENYPSCKWEAKAPGDLPPCEEEDERYEV